MKEIIGLIATVAAAGITAAAVSKKVKEDDDEEELREMEQEELELRRMEMEMEKERLKMEAEEKRHQLEQKKQEQLHRQELERQQMKKQQEQLEYQRKLENAPKKPVYKQMPVQCPRCMGARDISYVTGKAVCPYCDFIEPLIVDHYVIDQAAFQEQLRREEEERQKAIKEKNLRDSRLAFWAASVFVGLMVIPAMLLFDKLLLLYIFFLVWSLIALALYPNWKPLLWASIFPVPLTNLMISSDSVKQRFNTFVRILFIIGGWLAYILLLGGILALDIFNMRNNNTSSDPTPAVSYTAPATTVSTQPATEAVTLAATEPTTEMPTETELSSAAPDDSDNIFNVFADLPDKNGFTEETNQKLEKSYYTSLYCKTKRNMVK